MASHSDREDLGAWLVKCDPERFLITQARQDNVPIRTWTLTPRRNRRKEMIRAGDRVLVWVSGPADSDPVPGLWAVGVVTGPVTATTSLNEPDAPYWVDLKEAGTTRDSCPVNLRFLPAPIPRDKLKSDSRLRDLEVLKVPQASNPNFVTLDEWRVLEEYIFAQAPPRRARAIGDPT